MTQKTKSVQLLFLLLFLKPCDAQVSSEDVSSPPDGPGGDGSAFFALRSCHQLLQGDSGEFFSPDYLCSNPPLWCNWTITVDPGKRIHLNLEDLTPDDTCHLKQDQIHVDEPAGFFSGHKVLQKCWRESKITSSSSTLYVVLLIGGRPSPPYRGFLGRYQAFGPPVVYNPLKGLEQRREPGLSLGPDDFNTRGEYLEPDSQDYPTRADPDPMYDYLDHHAAMTAELPWEEVDADTEFFPQVEENQRPALANFSHVHPFLLQPTAPTVPTATQDTSRSERDAEQTLPGPPDPTESPQHIHIRRDHEVQAANRTVTAMRRNVEEDSEPQEGASDQTPAPPEEPTHPQPNMVEQLTDYRENYVIRNHSESPHLPGDHLFEVAVELNFPQYPEASWDHMSSSLKLPVKALISQKLESLRSPLSLSTKRIKRISVGALYILWLQVRRGPGALHVHRAVHSTLQGLATTPVISVAGKPDRGVIMSMSIADVNECGTQMVTCDVNADCINEFGSYACRCRPGFRDTSRIGPGGMVCADTKVPAACSSGLPAEAKGVYVLFFLLSLLILLLLALAATLYHRHHRGAFLVRCHGNGSHHDPNNNTPHHHRHGEGDPDLTPPPPPPPARSFREGWPQVKERLPPVDLPLLRFSPLLPPDTFAEPQEAVKM
ncbi:uncharacterized protein LOC141808721 [Halichoeres trimaculatus]|uniref:uncharacterized protein LOC141808721 n=1 Tax=Halichoeres trimaculatus TaxID=147232 RepID=UPI003D9E43FF